MNRRGNGVGEKLQRHIAVEPRIVEADGGQHAESVSDQRRTAFLESKGYRVLRFWNNDILQNLEGVAESILAALGTPHPAQSAAESPSPSRGEGICGAPHGY